jgi:hypothetical protein
MRGMTLLPVPVLLAWGVFSLAATQPWGYLPLMAGMAVYGAISLAACRRAETWISRGLCISLALLCGAILGQLIPLPGGLVGALSPARAHMAGDETLSAIGQTLTVAPAATALGLAFLIAFCLFFLGVAKTMRSGDATRLAAGVAVLGAAVALVGIAEGATSWPGVYRTIGLPLPPDSTPLGPFSSRNHYAGWMLMAFALTSGYLCAMLEQRAGRARWLYLFVQSAIAVMAVALVQTRSRAGILGLVLAAVTMSALLIRRHAAGRRRMIVAAPLLLLPLAGVIATGVEPVFARFAADTWATGHGRLPIWRQGVAMARDFPIAGSGFNTYRWIAPRYPTADLDEPYEGAHNDFLQLAIEGGLLVGVPALAAVAAFARDTRERLRDGSGDGATRWVRTGAVVGLLLFAAQETVDFSLQIPGNAALFVVLAAIAVHRAPRDISCEHHCRSWQQPEGTGSYA